MRTPTFRGTLFWAGYQEMESIMQNKGYLLILLLLCQTLCATEAASKSDCYLTKDSPPLLMIQGDKDTTIPVKHAYYMQEKAQALKAPVEIMIIKNAGHNWRRVDADIDPSRDEIIERTVQFFTDHL